MLDRSRLVHVVDDDEGIRRSVAFMLKTSGYQVALFETGLDLLKQVKVLDPGVILLDIRMPGMDGLDVQRALHDHGITWPVIIMSGHGDIPLSVRAMKEGAIDFVEKPFEKQQLVKAIDLGLEELKRTRDCRERAEAAAIRLAVLTAREREVLKGLAEGLPNKTIAYDLGISPRTVEIHRANLMAKLEVRSLSEALRLAFAIEQQA